MDLSQSRGKSVAPLNVSLHHRERNVSLPGVCEMGGGEVIHVGIVRGFHVARQSNRRADLHHTPHATPLQQQLKKTDILVFENTEVSP